MNVVRVNNWDVYVPLPDGFTLTQDGGDPATVVVEGNLPDTDKCRGYYVRITFDVSKEYAFARTCRVRVRQSVRRYHWDGSKHVDTGTWRSAGYGGVRMSTDVLTALLEGGRLW